jgi:pimeloyl-ACP methyl ester carboxylesterase
MRRPAIVALLWIFASAACGGAGAAESYGPQLETFSYPYPVQTFSFKSQSQQFTMAYMDVEPHGPAIGVAVLLHGKNFCGASWETTIDKLRDAGYRVVVPDQLGFCKSSKPLNYQYSLQQLAANMRSLLAGLHIGRIVLVGHSMGGMLAMRYAIMYPEQVAALVLVDPLGLEDWKAKGALYRTVDERYAMEMQTTLDRLRKYELEEYYVNRWQPGFDRWLNVLGGMYTGSGHERYAWNQALTSDMIFTQPVVYELERIRMPTLIIIGSRDRVSPFKEAAPPDVAAELGNYPELARRAAKRMENAHVVELADVGHVPQLEAPDRFHDALLQWLAGLPHQTSQPAHSP